MELPREGHVNSNETYDTIRKGSSSDTDKVSENVGGTGFVTVNQKKLRVGYTTGSCAAAAAGAAAVMLMTGEPVRETVLVTPAGVTLHLNVEEPRIERNGAIPVSASCSVRKDAGDDIDATDGILVCAEVRKSEVQGIRIDGGKGVGRVTKAGLDQPVGHAAINSVPRQMITGAVQKALDGAGFDGGADVVISVPEGEQIAARTFNPRLGIVGGISIIGTTGMVYPMSSKALVDSIRVEMKMRRANSGSWLCLAPGNYGERYALDVLGIDPEKETQCSNYIGKSIDAAVEYGFDGILFVSHIGKFVKVAGGIMNTHSHEADCRMELLAAAALRAGADADLARQILACNTSDDALDVLLRNDGKSPDQQPDDEKNVAQNDSQNVRSSVSHCDSKDSLTSRTMQNIMASIADHLAFRSGGKLKTGAIIFSSKHGISAATENAEELLGHLKKTSCGSTVS